MSKSSGGTVGRDAILLAEEALDSEDYPLAAEHFGKAIGAIGAFLQSSATARNDKEALQSFARALLGRGKALVELGRPRGSLPAQPRLLEAAIADSKKAVVLMRHAGSDVAEAVVALSDILLLAGKYDDAEAAVREAVAASPDSNALKKLQRKVKQKVLSAKMDADADDGRSPGTFRWPLSVPFPKFPPHSSEQQTSKSTARKLLKAITDQGWGPYLEARGGEALVKVAKSEAILLDGLSFPLSLAYALTTAGAAHYAPSFGRLHVLVLGATARAEVRVWLQTKYWQELTYLLTGVFEPEFHFIGPELDAVEGGTVHPCTPPCAKTFLEANKHMTEKNTICAIFNGGFGNFVSSGQEGLLWSWLPDLEYLNGRNFLSLFFCANDYADLKGEVAVHAGLLRSQFVVAPRKNPFAMATVYGDGEGPSKGKEWFCGNSFMYAICGTTLASSSRPASFEEDPKKREELISKVIAVANTNGEVEVAATDPPMLYPVEIEASASESKSTSTAPPSPPAMTPQKKSSNNDGGAEARITGASEASSGNPATEKAPASPPAPAPAPVQKAATPSASQAQPPSLPESMPSAPSKRPSVSEASPSVPSKSAAATLVHAEVSIIEVEGVLKMEVELPGMKDISSGELEISDNAVRLHNLPGFAPLEKAWVSPVDSAQAKASFSAKKEKLVVKAPIASP